MFQPMSKNLQFQVGTVTIKVKYVLAGGPRGVWLSHNSAGEVATLGIVTRDYITGYESFRIDFEAGMGMIVCVYSDL